MREVTGKFFWSGVDDPRSRRVKQRLLGLTQGSSERRKKTTWKGTGVEALVRKKAAQFSDKQDREITRDV